MKLRTGFVSNSSSSSFVVVKDALNNNQLNMILNYKYYVKNLLNSNKLKDNEKENFEYYNSDPWNIFEYDDFIFGETSMDNFDMQTYFDYIKIDSKMICWDDGYIDKPLKSQLEFVKIMKKKLRKNKIDSINNKL